MKKKVILIVLSAILLLSFLIMSLVFLIPSKRYAEFPFELVYKINDEIVTISDVYVCEFGGYSFNFNVSMSPYRVWEGYIKGTREEYVFLCEDTERKVYCFVGDAEYYMNDEREPENRPLKPRVFAINHDSGDFSVKSFYSSEEIMRHYNIEIISWSFSEPIEG